MAEPVSTSGQSLMDRRSEAASHCVELGGIVIAGLQFRAHEDCPRNTVLLVPQAVIDSLARQVLHPREGVQSPMRLAGAIAELRLHIEILTGVRI